LVFNPIAVHRSCPAIHKVHKHRPASEAVDKCLAVAELLTVFYRCKVNRHSSAIAADLMLQLTSDNVRLPPAKKWQTKAVTVALEDGQSFAWSFGM